MTATATIATLAAKHFVFDTKEPKSLAYFDAMKSWVRIPPGACFFLLLSFSVQLYKNLCIPSDSGQNVDVVGSQ